MRLRALVEAAADVSARLGPFSDLDDAWDLLAEAERIAPDVAEDVLMYPSVGVWLSRALRHVVGAADDSTPMWAEVGGFHALAAAAALRGGVPFTIAVPVLHGAVNLPSFGAFHLTTSLPVGHVLLRNSALGTSLTVPGGDSRTVFQPVKRHRSTSRGHSVEVAFDDLDPYREFGAPVRANPLSETDYDEWCKLLDDAWDLLTGTMPAAAEELAAGLAAVIPLPASREVVAASSSAAFGGIAMSPKRSAVEFGEALLHELQHSKVNGLLDLVELHDGDDEAKYYAPWRDDPRPAAALLHGVYAFLSVVEFWHLQRLLVPPALVDRAWFTFAWRANQVAQGVDTLRGAAELNDLGREFTEAASARLAACDPAAVPEQLAAGIDVIATDHRAVWRLRHVRPRADVVAGLADRRAAGETPPDRIAEGRVLPGSGSGDSPLTALLRLSLLDPARLSRIADRAGPDFALVDGRPEVAAARYAAIVHEAPTSAEAWSGLGIALGSAALRRTPEVVRAVYREIRSRSGEAPDPVELAAWFDQAAG